MIDDFLKEYDLSRYQVAQISGVRESTLQRANKSDNVSKLQVKTIMALAMATGLTPGAVLDKLIKIVGNPIIRFIQQHPFMDHDLVQQVEDKMIGLHEKGINLKNITFNRYYEGDDTNENAEIAMRNTLKTLKQIEKDIG